MKCVRSCSHVVQSWPFGLQVPGLLATCAQLRGIHSMWMPLLGLAGCTSRGPRGRWANVPRFCLCLPLPAGQLPGLDTEKASPGKSLWNNQEDGVTDFTWWEVTIRLMGRWYFSLLWSHRFEFVPDFLWPQQGIALSTQAGGAYEAQRLSLLEIGVKVIFLLALLWGSLKSVRHGPVPKQLTENPWNCPAFLDRTYATHSSAALKMQGEVRRIPEGCTSGMHCTLESCGDNTW